MITGLDPSDELETQRRLNAVIAAEYAKRFRAEISRQSFEMLATFEAVRGLPQQSPEYEPRIRAIYEDLALTTVRTFGFRILDQGKSMGLLQTKDIFSFAEFFQRIALEYIQQEIIRRLIVNVTETTRQQIIDMILTGQREGLSVDQIGRSIRDRIPQMSALRANTIARTETHGAANRGSFESAKYTGLNLQKEWLSLKDHRVRDFGQGDGRVDEYDHRGMNGQKVDMDMPFLMPWAKGDPIKCMTPGDVALPAAAKINCRCAVGYAVKG